MVRLGIIGGADIAKNRFLPALAECDGVEYVGVATRTGRNREQIVANYGGEVWDSYEQLCSLERVDAVYIPLPPALHYEWAKKALLSGKHVILEKPFTTSYQDTYDLIEIAKEKKLAVIENYGFLFHNQMQYIKTLLEQGGIGEIRHYDIRFGFPRRGENDFRYKKELGGGALLDCGGYTIRLASALLGQNSQVVYSSLHNDGNNPIDLYGNVTMVNEHNTVANLAFGMANEYMCSLEVWGSEGRLYTSRIFTAPPEVEPEICISLKGNQTTMKIPSCNQFARMIQHFSICIKDDVERERTYDQILLQSKLTKQVHNKNINDR